MGRSKRMTRRRKSYRGGTGFVSPFVMGMESPAQRENRIIEAWARNDVRNYASELLRDQFYNDPRIPEDVNLTVDEFIDKYIEFTYENYYPRVYPLYLRRRRAYLTMSANSDMRKNLYGA
jgi:hypothetical protein